MLNCEALWGGGVGPNQYVVFTHDMFQNKRFFTVKVAILPMIAPLSSPVLKTS